MAHFLLNKVTDNHSHYLYMKKGNKMKKRQSSGFTIIELMIVVGIIAILVAMAVPAYMDYSIRTKVTECISNSAVPKIQISEFYQTVGRYPYTDEVAAAMAPAGDSEFCEGFNYPDDDGTAGWFYVLVDETAISSGLGRIEPKLDPVATSNGAVDWICSRGQTPVNMLKYLPATCRGSDAPT